MTIENRDKIIFIVSILIVVVCQGLFGFLNSPYTGVVRI